MVEIQHSPEHQLTHPPHPPPSRRHPFSPSPPLSISPPPPRALQENILPTQNSNSALRTQHSALSTQHSALRTLKIIHYFCINHIIIIKPPKPAAIPDKNVASQQDIKSVGKGIGNFRPDQGIPFIQSGIGEKLEP